MQSQNTATPPVQVEGKTDRKLQHKTNLRSFEASFGSACSVPTEEPEGGAEPQDVTRGVLSLFPPSVLSPWGSHLRHPSLYDCLYPEAESLFRAP